MIGMGDAPFTLKVRILKAEVMETLLYGWVTWTLGQEHFAELRTAHDALYDRGSTFPLKCFLKDGVP